MLGRNMLSMTGLSLYRNVVQFGLNVLLAAFVTPAEYGLVVFTTPFLILISLLTDMGMSAAIVRTPELSRRQAGAAMGVMALLALVAAALLALAAGPIERQFGIVGLAPVMSAMAGVVVFSILASTPRALMERRLRYGAIAKVEATATAIAAVAGVAAAFAGAGVWSLVLYNLLGQGLRAVIFGWLSRREFSLNFEVGQVAPLLAFGGWVLATNVLNFLARNGDNLLIGASLGAAAVGVYGLAYQFMVAPLMAITWPTSGILLATLRTTDPGSPMAQDMVKSVIAATAMLTIPATVYLAFGLAWPASQLLSDRWQAVPQIVAWLAPAGALQSIASYNGALLLAAGRARAQFMLSVVNTVVLLATFVLSLPYGLMVLVRTYAGVITVMSFAFLGIIVALTGLRWTDLARAVAPPLVGTGVGLAAASLVGLPPESWLEWILATALFGLGVLGSYAVFHREVRRTVRVLAARPATGS